MLERLKRAGSTRFNGLTLEDVCEYSKKDMRKFMSKIGELKKKHTFSSVDKGEDYQGKENRGGAEEEEHVYLPLI